MYRTGGGRREAMRGRSAPIRGGFEGTRTREAGLVAALLLSLLIPMWRGGGRDVVPLGHGRTTSAASDYEAPMGRERLAASLVLEARQRIYEGRSSDAVDLGLRALELDPTEPDVYDALADACLALGDGACSVRARRALALVVGRPR